ncbi:hypothetical protein [Streptomyces rhizosphaerihabitans]|uniref:hypothetical protein n=1 Tax=Streptomyces rhizosphaerihabitans TaxID=1266770 RepID=UPI0021BE43D1|nr:hypothetical protein [Streptomyces rhizosphaerihabitans]MCT9009998.1 hypothetical protein [Streptomyces rhizosphaerihabitans]
MAQNLMVWLIERRVVLEERTAQLRKQLADTEAEVARLGAAEVVYQQYQEEDAEAGHPDAAAWQQALEEATGGTPAAPPRPVGTPGAAGQLLIPHRGPGTGTDDLPADYQKIMEIVAGGDSPLQAKDVARELGLDAAPAKVEPVRGKLRKLAERGWITRTPAGRYLPR